MSTRSLKVDLHEQLKKHSFEHALITTFTFGTRFFEDYALENFRSLQENANITVVVDEGEYRDLLESASASPESFPKQANLRYLLHPVRVPGVFHPKIFFFANKKRGLLMIGSANFTQDGLGSNAELVATFNYEEEKNEEALPLFKAAFDFFEQIAARWPSEQLRSNLDALVAEVPWISKEDAGTESSKNLPVLLSNLDEPLWDQLVRRLPSPVTQVSVLSRFYDAQPGLIDHLRQTTNAKRISLYTQNGITTLTKAWLQVPAFLSGEMEVRLCRYTDGEHFQQLHGKAYAFTSGKEVVLALGSANFTNSALRRTASNGNLEVLLCYPASPSGEFSPKAWFDPDGESIRLREEAQLQTAPENTDEPPSPGDRFAIKLIEAIVDGDWLTLRLGDGDVEGLVCRITQGSQRQIVLNPEPAGLGRLRCRLDEPTCRRLAANPSIAQLGVQVSESWAARSHPVLVANIHDANSGRDLRRERQIREARQSPQRFIDVLNVLARGEDEERLKQFLTYCDIPIDLPTRLLRRGRGAVNPPPDASGSFIMTSGRHIRTFELLHEAVMDFALRHHRRLDRHVERGTAKGINNFLHILLTVCGLIISQIERLIAALEIDSELKLTSEQWKRIRDNLEDYYMELEKLLQVTADDYFNALLEAAPLARFQGEFAEGLPEIDGVIDRLVRSRERLLTLQKTRLLVVTPTVTVAGPGFFSSVLAPAKWPAFEKRICLLQTGLKQRLAV